MFNFGERNLSGFINRIFKQYVPEAEASISLRLNEKKGELDQSLEDIKDENAKEKIVKILLKQEEDRLLKKVKSYERGKSVKFWLNKDNLHYLTGTTECNEEKYYGSRRGKYIKSVLEEYARLPYVQRERIYFADFLEKIQNAIQAKPSHQLRVETSKGTVYSVYPYTIRCDPLSTANYLVGYSRQYDHPKDDLNSCSFRISALKSIKEEKSKSAFLKASLNEELEKKISEQGVQFMVTDVEEVLVRLSPAGKDKYRRHPHLRPALKENTGPENDIFVFQCTTMQAEFYFFKFGADAEILKPISLRERFIDLHKNALNVYLATKEDAPSESNSE